MRVAVIIPFWNGGRWIERAVESVVHQNRLPNEFIVVNDGSLPAERAHLETLRLKHGFRVLDKENGGQGSARNFGVLHCTSELICFLDQDDFYLPDHIETLVSQIPSEPDGFGFAYGSFHIADETGEIHVHHSLGLEEPRFHPPPPDPVELFGRNISILPSASIILKSAFDAVGGFDVQFRGYEDDDLFSRMILAGFECSYVPVPVYVWCQHKGSTTWTASMTVSRYRYYKKIRQIYTDKASLTKDLIVALEVRFGRFFYKSAALNLSAAKEDKLLVWSVFTGYVEDVKQDCAPISTRLLYRFRFIVLSCADIAPISWWLDLKRWNRRRVDDRRVRSGRIFLK